MSGFTARDRVLKAGPLTCPFWSQCVDLHVPLHMQGQMIGPGEGTLTEVALKRPVTRMFSEVTGQLI